MSNTPPKQPGPSSASAAGTAAGAPGPGIQLTGGAAILAPVSAFQNGVPANALVLKEIDADGYFALVTERLGRAARR